MAYLDDYQAYTDPLETPQHIKIWCAMSALAACAQRKIWLDMGHFKISPNLYIVLDGPPGVVRKSTSMGTVQDLLRPFEKVRIQSDSITFRKVLSSMEATRQPFSENGNPAFHCSLTLFANEMGVLVKEGDKDFVIALNSMYDCKPEHRHGTEHYGSNFIPNPYLNILACTTPDWVSENLGADIIGGGFSARAIFVLGMKREKVNPFPMITAEGRAAKDRLQNTYARVLDQMGEVKFSEAGFKFYYDWYMAFYNEDTSKNYVFPPRYENPRPPNHNPKMAPYTERKFVHLLKLSLLFSMADRGNMLLEDDDLLKAMYLLDLTEPSIEQALKGIGRNVLSPIAEKIFAQIKSMKQVSIADLAVSNMDAVNNKEFSEILIALRQQNRIEMFKGPNQDDYVRVKERK